MRWSFVSLAASAVVAFCGAPAAADEEPIAYHETSLTRLAALAGAGDVLAMHELAERHLFGTGVLPDIEKAAHWYRIAAEHASVTAIHWYAVYLVYRTGLIDDEDPDLQHIPEEHEDAMVEALAWLNVGALCDPGTIVELQETLRRAMKFSALRKAERRTAELYDQFIAGSECLAAVPSLEEIEELDRSRFDLDFLTKLADGGDVGAMEELGRRYRYGIGVTADLEVAIEWFHMAATLASNDGIMAYVTYLDIIEKHGPEAEEINREIMLHEYGESLIEALAWFDIDAACHQGAAEFRDALIGVLGPVRVERAQERAAELRTKGAIVTDPGSCDVESVATAQEIDYDTATADVLREAAHRGDRRAMLAIGVGYLDGVLAGVDENAAEAWLAEVSGRGVVEGMTAFGVLSNELSARAFDADPDGDEWLHLLYQAYAWFAMAADCGSLDSAEWKTALSDGMNADVLATAERITQRMYDTFFADLPEEECVWLESVPPAAPHVVDYMYATTERLRELADGEDVAAMVSLGHRYLLGYLADRDLEKAGRWFADAALRGGPVGMFGLAQVLLDVSVAKFEADPDDDEWHDLLLGAFAWAAIAADCGFGKAAEWNAETFKGFDAEFWRLAQKMVGLVFEDYFGERTLVNVCLRWE